MDWSLIAIGLAIGFAVAAPLGPVNLIVIRTSLTHGVWGGLAAGAGAVAADTGFAAISAYGIRSIGGFILTYGFPLQLLGGVLLVVIGIHTARMHVTPAELTELPGPASAAPIWRRAASALLLTATNPGALFGMLGLFGALGTTMQLGLAPSRPAFAVAGVAAGGMLWWLILSLSVNWLKWRLTAAAIDRLNRWAGVLIAAFGFALLMVVFG